MIMRTVLLAAIIGVAANSGAQAPLTIDPSFNIYITPEYIEQWYDDASVYNILEREDGTILVGGTNIDYPGRIPPSSSSVLIDQSGEFVPSNFINVPASGMTPLSNGQYLANHRRWNHDGTRDTTWDYYPDNIRMWRRGAWHVFDDLSMLVGGLFAWDDESSRDICLIKLDEYGQYDPSWQVRHCDVDAEMYHMHPLRNGQYLIGGNWANYDGQATGPFVRINTDGTPDLDFHFNAYKGRAAVIHELDNCKLMMGGVFFMDNYIDTLKLLRLNPDGSLDETFDNYGDYRFADNPFGSAFSGINVITPLDENRFVVGGSFDSVNGEPRNCICCVDTLGNLLDCWAGGGLMPVDVTPGGGPLMWLGGFKQLSNGDWYMYGQYKGFVDANGVHADQVVMSRLHGPDVGVEERSAPSTLRGWPNPGTDHIQFNWPGHPKYALTVRDALGRAVHNEPSSQGIQPVDVSEFASGIYTVQAIAASGERTETKWTKE
jgi:hypothetical protein